MKTEIIFIPAIIILAGLLFFSYDKSVVLQNELVAQEEDYVGKIANLNSSLQEYTKNYSELKMVVVELEAQPLFNMNPTLKEVEEILRNDNTDRLIYRERVFDCKHFSFNLVNAFLKEKIHACVHLLEFDDGAHSLVAVNTKDKGIIFIEPQTDKIMYTLNVGDDYCKEAYWDCNWIIVSDSNCYSYKK